MPTPCSQACWVIGYGNPQRRDDGIGPRIVGRLRGLLRHREGVHLLELPQLSADLVGELCDADDILFIDATVDEVAGGRAWHRVHPDMQMVPYLTHHVHPAYLLGLIRMIYHRSPQAWLISVQGSDFGLGEGLSPEAEAKAEAVGWEVLQVITKKGLTERTSIEKIPIQE